MTTTRYAIVGTGHRAEMYVDAITTLYPETTTLAALCDPNTARATYYVARSTANGAPAPTVWNPNELEQMIRDETIDRAIIASRDDTHPALIIRCLEPGVDVMVEKPHAIDAESAAAIEHAVARTGRNVVDTFNYRYSPRNSALREVIQSGRIGTVTSIDFSWMLDTKHGADYF